jgi:hypothetical protein
MSPRPRERLNRIIFYIISEGKANEFHFDRDLEISGPRTRYVRGAAKKGWKRPGKLNSWFAQGSSKRGPTPRGSANGDSFVRFTRSACSHTRRSQSADSVNPAGACRSETGCLIMTPTPVAIPIPIDPPRQHLQCSPPVSHCGIRHIHRSMWRSPLLARREMTIGRFSGRH